jgi:serine/threonine protein kinase
LIASTLMPAAFGVGFIGAGLLATFFGPLVSSIIHTLWNLKAGEDYQMTVLKNKRNLSRGKALDELQEVPSTAMIQWLYESISAEKIDGFLAALGAEECEFTGTFQTPEIIDNEYKLAAKLGPSGHDQSQMYATPADSVVKLSSYYDVPQLLLLREYSHLARLKGCPGVPRIQKIGYIRESDSNHIKIFLVIERIPGQDIEAILTSKVIISPDQLFALVKRILLILKEIHKRKILHKDIKLKNIVIPLIEGQWRFDQAYLVDYEFAMKISDDGNKIILDEPEGTLEYLADGLNQRIYNAKTDMYALGIILVKIINIFNDAGLYDGKKNVAEIYRFALRLTGIHFNSAAEALQALDQVAPGGIMEIVKQPLMKILGIPSWVYDKLLAFLVENVLSRTISGALLGMLPGIIFLVPAAKLPWALFAILHIPNFKSQDPIVRRNAMIALGIAGIGIILNVSILSPEGLLLHFAVNLFAPLLAPAFSWHMKKLHIQPMLLKIGSSA